MTFVERVSSLGRSGWRTSPAVMRCGALVRALAARPVAVFVLLGSIFGTLAVGLTPPLRGPDEPAHFLRAYGYSGGEILGTADASGRKGLHLPERLYDDFALFRLAVYRVGTEGFNFPDAMRGYWTRRQAKAEEAAEQTLEEPPVFVHFEGSEGYSPVPYLPHIAGALVGRLLGFDTVELVYLMRLAGLAAMTAVSAYAIAVTPHLKWAFVLIALLPSALYGRAIISGDGAVLAFTLASVALGLRAASGFRSSALQRSVWTALCVLAKPPQIAFVLLEAMSGPIRDLGRRWQTVALVVLPALVLSPLWVLTISADMAAWRISGDLKVPAEQFEPLWKLRYLFAHPLHFPMQVWGSLTVNPIEYGRQLIGVLGWLDNRLPEWVYAALPVLLAISMVDRLAVDRPTRLRLAAVAAATAFGYAFCLLFIFYLSWTPVAFVEIAGVQGRYFLPVLPLAAIVVAALADRRIAERAPALAAILGGLVSGAAVVHALAQEWRFS